MIESHPPVPHLPVAPFKLHVSSAEDGGGHGDKGGQDDEIDIEGIDKEVLVPDKECPLAIDLYPEEETEKEHDRRGGDIDLVGILPVTYEGEYRGAEKGNTEDQQDKHHSSSLSLSISLKSRLSKVVWMWKIKIPKMKAAIRISRATPSSTTSDIP